MAQNVRGSFEVKAVFTHFAVGGSKNDFILSTCSPSSSAMPNYFL